MEAADPHESVVDLRDRASFLRKHIIGSAHIPFEQTEDRAFEVVSVAPARARTVADMRSSRRRAARATRMTKC